jgi:hypothetical protein
VTAATYTDHATEIYSASGPTGRFARVLTGELRDAGGNVLFAGSAAACVQARRKWRSPTVLVPVTTECVGTILGADCSDWQCVIE